MILPVGHLVDGGLRVEVDVTSPGLGVVSCGACVLRLMLLPQVGSCVHGRL